MEKQARQTVMEYLRWRGDLSFAADPFNEVDQLILCILAYLSYRRFPSLTTVDADHATPLRTLAPLMREEDEQQGLSQLEYLPLMRAAAASARFADVGVFGYLSEYDEKEEKQFDAVSFLLPDRSMFCAFMGTDTTIVGWKEDLNMSFLDTVPAQRRAAEYVETIAAANRGKIRIGGHSKGGNLALYGALYVSPRVQKRILDVYNNDGPGFRTAPWQGEEYLRMKDRIHTYIPAESIVGTLLEQVPDYAVVSSHEKFLLQHEPMSWQVEQNHFKRLPQRSKLGQLMDRVTSQWVASMTAQERREFSDGLYEVLCDSGRNTTLEEVWQRGGDVLRHYREKSEQREAIRAGYDKLKQLWKTELHRIAEQELKETRQGLKDTGDVLRRRLLEKKKR